MRKTVVVAILTAIVVIAVVFAMVVMSSENTSMEVEDVLDAEIMPAEETPEVQDILNEIERIRQENDYIQKEREWISSGPFQIDRTQYALGEKIFMRIGGLDENEKGQVAFMRPLNDTHYSVYQTVPFDGQAKTAFNYYIDPQISKAGGMCTMEDILGNWIVVFRGTDYQNLNFEIVEKFVPGTESSFESVC